MEAISNSAQEMEYTEPAEPSSHRIMSQSTNNSGGELSENMTRLSLSAAISTPLPPSSPVAPPMAISYDHRSVTPSSINRRNGPPLRRAPSSSSLNSSERSTTPTLHKKTSLSSLRGAGGVTPPRSPALRRSSSHFGSSSGTTMGARSSLPPPAEEPPRSPATAASVAHDFFGEELKAHVSGVGIAEGAQTVVILQDDCYGHRYSRPRTSRANLSTIVERPERIHASILGLATAYVRLGGRHQDGSAAPHPKKHHNPHPPAPFRIQKTARRLPLRSPAVSAIHGWQWMDELSNMCDAAESRLALSGKELTRPGAAGQVNGNARCEKPKLHEGDLYLCSGSLKALEGALGGVCEGVDAIFKDSGPKRAFVCIRPPGHHCSADMPSGFCWLNNVHVGIGHAVMNYGLTHAAIIDFDLHHGDGSQSIAWAHNSRMSSLPKNTPISRKTTIGYFSMHDINSYPCEEGDDDKVRNASLCIENAHGQTIWNVHLQPWKTEAEFWQLYEQKYSVILTKARSFLRLHSERLRQAPTHPKPNAAIFLSAGFDASEWESPGMQRHQVNVPTSFYARLTHDIVAMAEEDGLGVYGRVISVLEGGYSDRALVSGILSHISGMTTTTATAPREQSRTTNGLGQEMSRRLGQIDLSSDHVQASFSREKVGLETFDSAWWSLPRLEEVENITNPPNSTAPKKQRNEVRPTYTSTTQSFTAKVVSPPQGRRSFSSNGNISHYTPTVRPPTPPPPAVDWATAAYELSKLLVPSDRETRSCKPEDLNAEASRARRDRYSTVGLPTPSDITAPVNDVKRMQLRDRRGKTPQYVSEDEEEQPVSRASRRKTIADVSLLNDEAEAPALAMNSTGTGMLSKHTRRRSSIASNAGSMTAEKGLDFSMGSTTETQPKTQPPLVKKPRVSANTRALATNPKPAKKQPPVPKFSSSSSTTTILEDNQAPVALASETTKPILSPDENLRNKDLDQLASGMRKMSIKLNVPSKEEYEARHTKPKPAPKGRPPKSAAGKANSPAKAKVKSVKQDPRSKSLHTEPLLVQQLPPPAISAGPHQALAIGPPSVAELPLQPAASPNLPEESNSFATPKSPAPLHDTTAKMPNVIQTDVANNSNTERKAETAGPAPPPVAEPQHTEVTHPSPPITVKRSKQDVPIFTSTSLISFGGSKNSQPTIDQTVSQESNTISDTSRHSHPFSSNQFVPDRANAVQATMQPVNQPSISPANVDVKGETMPPSSASIWDVPDTPQPRKL